MDVCRSTLPVCRSTLSVVGCPLRGALWRCGLNAGVLRYAQNDNFFLRVGGGDFDDGGEVSEVVVGGDFFDLRLLFGVELGVAGEVGGGDLEAVEEDAAALVIDISAGEAAEDFVEGELDGGAVVDARHGEGAGAAGDGGLAAGTAMVVAEALAAECGRAAAMAFGEDVAAEVAAFRVGGCGFGWRYWCGFRHGGTPRT